MPLFMKIWGIISFFGLPEYPHQRVTMGRSFNELDSKSQRLIKRLISKKGIIVTIRSPFGSEHQVHLSGEFTKLDTDQHEFAPTAVCNDFE